MTMTPAQTRLADIRTEARKLGFAYATMAAEKGAEFSDVQLLMQESFALITALVPTIKVIRNAENMDVLQLLFSRGMKSHRSIMVLVINGCDQDANAILRNLIETGLNLKYIARGDTASLCARFRDFGAIERLQRNRRCQKPIVGPEYLTEEQAAKIKENFSQNCSDAEVNQIETAAQKFIADYSAKHTMSWSGLRLNQLAARKEVDGYETYITAYTTYCLFTHPTFLSRSAYAAPGTTIPIWLPTFAFAENAAVLATAELCRIAEEYLRALGAWDSVARVVFNEIHLNVGSRMTRLTALANAAGIPVAPKNGWIRSPVNPDELIP